MTTIVIECRYCWKKISSYEKKDGKKGKETTKNTACESCKNKLK